MLALPGYQIFEIIYQGRNSVIYRGLKLEDPQCSVIIKVAMLLKSTADNKLQHEWKMRQLVQSAHVVKYLALKEHPTYGTVLVEEDEHTETLSHYLPKSGFDVPVFLNIALQLAEGLRDIHQGNVIHNDIKPSNILFQPDTGRVKYIDFGSAASLHQIKRITTNPDVSGGTLPYLSPEQTGRINRLLDYRTDFYSLGITFYQLLCGQLPFEVKDILQLIYCHLAKQPIAPHVVNPHIPVPLSEIVMKLLNKDAEDRYQSASGLLRDLKRCLSDLKEKGEIVPFALAQQDIPERFYVPQKLYGREHELALLIQTFERARQGRPEVIMLTGPAGTGKSVLVNELQPAIAVKKGYFLTGKFDQSNRGIAYGAITQAFQSWVKQLLFTASEEEISVWKQQILAALGKNSPLLVEVVPDLHLIIGQQPPVLTVDAEQAKNRFQLAFQNFITVLARPEHPLVLFLDDWQWADIASLKLIETMLVHPDMQGLLLMGAYRDNEVEATHPALRTLAAIQKTGTTVQTVPLSPLSIASVNQWVAEAMHSASETTLPLTTLIDQKTRGNPFFIRAFLQALYEKRLLNYSEEGWQWDLDSIRQLPATENIIEFMAHQIQQLPPETQNILTFASYLGHRFTLPLLQLVSQTIPEQAATELQALVDSGFLFQSEEGYQFVHDRIQEAAYELVPLEQQAPMHLSIGRLLQANLPAQPTLAQEFEMLDHLNQGNALITSPQEQLALARLNLEVAQKAKRAIAYKAALSYLHFSEAYLRNSDIWIEHYDLASALYKEMAEIEYLNGHYEQSHKLITLLLIQLRSTLEKAEVYRLLILQKVMQAQYQDAIERGYEALRLLGIDLVDKDLASFLKIELEKIAKKLEGRTIDALFEAPLMQAADKKAILLLLYCIYPAALLSNRTLFGVLITLIVNLTLEYGNAEQSAMGYMAYGMMLIAKLNIKAGCSFGLLALKLSDKFHCPDYQGKINFSYATQIHHWAKPMQQADVFIERGQQYALEAGDFQCLGYISALKAMFSFHKGSPLVNINSELNQQLQLGYNQKNQVVLNVIKATQMIVLNLTGKTKNILKFHDENKTDVEYETSWRKENDSYTLYNYFIFKAQAYYVHGCLEQAHQCMLTLEKVPPLPAHISATVHNFYYALILAALYPSVTIDLQAQYWQQLETYQQQIKIFSDNCPENFLHKYWLVKAEMARLQGKAEEAEALYDKAIEAAQEQNFIQEHALACELAAKFWLARKRPHCAKAYLYDAYNSYSRWGAKRKTEMLVCQYPDLLKASFTSHLSSFPISSEETIKASSLALIDMTSVLKASQTLASEIELSKLLFNMMQVMVENAGAQTGAFWVAEADALWLQADYSLEGRIQTLQKLPLSQWEQGSRSLIEYVKHTQQPVLLGDACHDPQFRQDPYFTSHQTKSVLCMPLIQKKQLKGILYLGNNLLLHAFTEQHQQILTMLASQMAISLENAVLYESTKSITEQLNLALQSGNVGTWRWNIQTNQIIWDERMYGLLGVQPEEFAHTLESFLVLVHPDDRARVEQALKRASEESVAYSLEYRIIKPDKNIYHLLAQGKVYRNDQGEAERMLGVIWDLTQRKHLEEERLQALIQGEEKEHRRAEDAEKYRKNLEDFINMVCHEIRNPMTGIYGNIDFLQQTAASLKSFMIGLPVETQSLLNKPLYKLDEITQEITQCIKHQKTIIDDVLDLSKLESGKLVLTAQPVRLKSVIEAVAQIFAAPLALKNLPLIVALPESDPWVKVDANYLKIALVNLVANALKFTERGHITLQLQLLDVTPAHTTFTLTVEDTGIGMTPQELSHVFQRFARVASTEYEGSGLGLVISKRFVECMGGRIDVNSQKGHGSQFTLQLTCESVPVEEKQPAQQVPPPPAPTGQPLSLLPTAKHILVVEDNVVNQRILCRQLKQAGHTCEVANNGQEAVDKWAAASFDLILMDIEMPIMGGLEATKTIRQREQLLNRVVRTPIVALSAFTSSEFIKQAHEVGMQDYITKPYEKEKIYQAINQWAVPPPKPSLPQPLIAGTLLALKTVEATALQPSIPVAQTELTAHEMKPAYLSTLFWSGPPPTTTTLTRTWAPERMRNALYPLLDTVSVELNLRGINTALPAPQFRDKTSKTGWQLYAIKENDEYWAVLNFTQEMHVDKLMEAINQGQTQLSVKKMKSGAAYAVNLIFSNQMTLKTAIEKIIPQIQALSKSQALLCN